MIILVIGSIIAAYGITLALYAGFGGATLTLQSMLQASFSIVDQIMIGQLGETNISAVGLCGNFSLIFSVVIGAVSTVAGILIAQFIGAEDTKEAWSMLRYRFWQVLGQLL